MIRFIHAKWWTKPRRSLFRPRLSARRTDARIQPTASNRRPTQRVAHPLRPTIRSGSAAPSGYLGPEESLRAAQDEPVEEARKRYAVTQATSEAYGQRFVFQADGDERAAATGVVERIELRFPRGPAAVERGAVTDI